MSSKYLFVLGSVSLVYLACSSKSSSDAAPTTAKPPIETCNFAPTAQCDAQKTCLEGSCSNELTTCLGADSAGGDCADYSACVAACACGDGACVLACVNSATTSCSACQSALRTCNAQNCAEACTTPPPATTHSCGDLSACCVSLTSTYQQGCVLAVQNGNEQSCDSYYQSYCRLRTCKDLMACCATLFGASLDNCNADVAAAAGNEIQCAGAIASYGGC